MSVAGRIAALPLRADERMALPDPRAPRLWPPALSAALHALALAAVLGWLVRPAPHEPTPDAGVAVVWDQEPGEESLNTGEPGAPPPPAVPSPVPPPEAAIPPVPAPVAAAAPPVPEAAAPPPPTAVVASAPPPVSAALPPPPPLARDLVTLPPPPAPAPRDAPAAESAQQIAEALPLPPVPPPPPQPVAPSRPAPRPAPAQVTASAAVPAPAPAGPERPGAPLFGTGAPPLVLGGSRVVGAVTPPKLLEGFRNPQPEYPVGSSQRGEQGDVRVLILIDENGRVTGVEVSKSSGFPALDAAARKAAAALRFRPAMRDGVAVPGSAGTTYHFVLK